MELHYSADEYESSDHGEDKTTTTEGRSSNSKVKGKDKKKVAAPCQRVWREDDEIMMLQGFIHYSKKNSIKDISGFYNFFNKSINADISRRQLGDKLSRLKKKILDFESKGGDNKTLPFRKPHDQKVFDLSMMIWGKTSATDNECVVTTDYQNLSGTESEENKVSDDHDTFIPLPALFKDYLSDHGLDLHWIEESIDDLIKGWSKVKNLERKYFLLKSRLDDMLYQLLYEANLME